MTPRFSNHLLIVPGHYACKFYSKYPGIKLESALQLGESGYGWHCYCTDGFTSLGHSFKRIIRTGLYSFGIIVDEGKWFMQVSAFKSREAIGSQSFLIFPLI